MLLKGLTRGEIQALLPARGQDILRSLRDLTPARRNARMRDLNGQDALALEVSPNLRVLGGPFAGLNLGARATWGGSAARLAGKYEVEIVPAIEALIRRSPTVVVDVGAAEGYYAIGLAVRLPSARVHAFELEPHARKVCRTNMALNGVRNVTVHGRATVARLARVLAPGALVVSDCEGYESVLLDPQRVPMLRECDLLVELHEFVQPGITELLLERFSASHAYELIDARARTADDALALGHMRPERAQEAIQEGRPQVPPMQWAVFSRHTRLS